MDGKGLILPSNDDNPAMAYLVTQRSQIGRYTMQHKLDKVALLLSRGALDWSAYPWHTLTDGVVQAVIAKLLETYKPSYVNGILAALKGVAKAARRQGRMSLEMYQYIHEIESIKGDSLPPGRFVPSNERQALIAACEDDPAPIGARDAAILAMGYPGGLRRSEIVSLERADVTPNGDTIAVRVRGKGRKERAVTLAHEAYAIMSRWLAIRGDVPGPLFWANRKNRELRPDRGMGSQAIYMMLIRRSKQAGIARLTPHDLRRATASELLDVADVITTAKYLGHKDPATTQKYDRRGERSVKDAAKKLHI